MKVEQYQDTLPKVHIGANELDNVYSFVYLGGEIARDGDQEVTVKHRCDIAWGRFGEYRRTWTTTKLSVNLRVRLFTTLIVSTMTYGSSAWLFTTDIQRKINGVSSKMLSQITKRTIHQEAKYPTLNVVKQILKRRWNYLGHILRLNENRALRRYLLELSPTEAPFIPGSLLADTKFDTVNDLIAAANNRENWKELWNCRYK